MPRLILSWNGKKIPLNYGHDEARFAALTLSKLKSDIKALSESDIDADQVTISFNNKILEGENPIRGVGVVDGSELVLIMNTQEVPKDVKIKCLGWDEVVNVKVQLGRRVYEMKRAICDQLKIPYSLQALFLKDEQIDMDEQKPLAELKIDENSVIDLRFVDL